MRPKCTINGFNSNTFTYKNANLENAMIGNHVTYDGDFKSISIGDVPYRILYYLA
jgi:hypothetical protein